MIITGISVAIASCYCFLVAYNLYYWRKNVIFYVENLPEPTESIKVSLLVAFRNEAENLPALIASIKKMHEVETIAELVFINDHSTDSGAEQLAELLPEATVLNLPAGKQGKKAALEFGMAHIKTEYVFLTDADCMLPSEWFVTLYQFCLQSQADMVLAPVKLLPSKFMNKFQQIDFSATQIISAGMALAGKPILANGANLAIRKASFDALQNPLNHFVSSGDDVFMLHAFKAKNFNIKFLKSEKAVVETASAQNLNEFLMQKIRWASKAKAYTDIPTRSTGIIVLLTNLWLLFLVFQLKSFCLLALVFYLLKLIADTILVSRYLNFTKTKISFVYFIQTELLYPIYSLIGLFAFFSTKFTWKNRKYSK